MSESGRTDDETVTDAGTERRDGEPAGARLAMYLSMCERREMVTLFSFWTQRCE